MLQLAACVINTQNNNKKNINQQGQKVNIKWTEMCLHLVVNTESDIYDDITALCKVNRRAELVHAVEHLHVSKDIDSGRPSHDLLYCQTLISSS